MKRKLVKGCAVCLCVGAPLIATLTQFPLWIERSSEATVSGLCVVFALLSAVPLFKYFKKLIESPSSPIMWGLILCFLYALRAIVDEMIVISFVGFVSNLIGWGMFKLAERGEIPKQSN